MEGVFWKGGSQEVARPTIITQLIMEVVCILFELIEIQS
jgi:hypothetical protein